MDLLWYIPNMLNYILDFTIYTIFLELFFTPKNKLWNKKKIIFIIFSLIICVMYVIAYFFSIDAFPIFLIIYLLYARYYYSGRFLYMIAMSIIELIFLGLLLIPVQLLIYNFIGAPYPSSQLDIMYSNLCTFISLTIIYAIICLFKINRQKKLHIYHKDPYLVLILFIMFACLIFMVYIVKYYRTANFSVSSYENLVAIIFICILLVMLSLIAIYSQSVKHLQNEYEYKLQIQFNEMQQDYYDKITASSKELSSLRHDLKNHLIVLDGYLAKGKPLEARSYIKDIVNISPVSSSVVNLENIMLSSVLTQKKTICLEKTISFHYNVVMGLHTIQDTDLCILLGNILDNAIEASELVADKKGYIDLELNDSNEILSIHCSNNYYNEPIMRNGKLLTTKSSRILHGIGMQNIADMVKKYDGTLDYHFGNHLFSIDILLKY